MSFLAIPTNNLIVLLKVFVSRSSFDLLQISPCKSQVSQSFSPGAVDPTLKLPETCAVSFLSRQLYLHVSWSYSVLAFTGVQRSYILTVRKQPDFPFGQTLQS